MKRLESCEDNFDNCCVELKFTDGRMITIFANTFVLLKWLLSYPYGEWMQQK